MVARGLLLHVLKNTSFYFFNDFLFRALFRTSIVLCCGSIIVLCGRINASFERTSSGFNPSDSAKVFNRSILDSVVFGRMLKPLEA